MYILQEHWNRVVQQEERVKERNYIRCSDIGKPYIDRFYSMRGIPQSNPPSERVLRIFDAGHVIEFIVMRSLSMAGILNEKQLEVRIPETDDHLQIYGYLDATIGGFTSWDEARERSKKHATGLGLDIDPLLTRKSQALIAGLEEEYPDGWQEQMLVEVKSINSMSFWSGRNRDGQGKFQGYDHNKLQLYAYLQGTGLRQGILLYVSKDDFTLAEVPVTSSDDDLDKLYWQDITEMSRYHRTNEVPPLEDEVVYNPKKEKWELNWRVERSPYLTHAYGYESPEALEAKHHQYLLDVNRAFKHLKEGKVKEEDKQHIEFWGMYDLIPF